jgi:tetratricopeptide (TPR) repeat protein
MNTMRSTPRCSQTTRAKRVVALAALLAAFSSTALADNQDDKSVALALFEQGRSFVAQGDYAKAAVKFEGAAKILHTFGILFNLANCYEKLGRTASAWSTWREAGSVARAANKPDDEARAAEHERALSPALSQLTIVVPQAAQLPDLEISRNGAAVPRAAWEAPLPVDPGEQTIELRANAHRAQRLSIVVLPNGDKKTLTIPALEPDPTAPQITSPAPSTEHPSEALAASVDTSQPSSRRLVGWVTAGTGAAVLVAGIVEWRMGQGKMDDAVSQANTAIASNDRAAYQAASDDHSSGQSQRTVGFVLLGLGGAATVTGVALALTSPRVHSESAASVRLGPWFGASGPGLVCSGHW